MKLSGLRLFNKISQLQQPSSEEFKQYFSEFSTKYKLLMPISLGYDIAEYSVSILKEYFSTFIDTLLAALDITLSPQEFVWYRFGLILNSLVSTIDKNYLDLFSEYISLPQLYTANEELQYIEYRIYNQMLPIYIKLNIPDTQLQQILDKINNTPEEIKSIPNNNINFLTFS